MRAKPKPVSEEESALFEERAIREFLGGFPRAEAERLAREDVQRILAQKNAKAGAK